LRRPLLPSSQQKAPDIAAQNEVEAEDEEGAEPVGPSHPKAEIVTLELPVRSYEILAWLARARRLTMEECARLELHGALTRYRRDFRESSTGSAGATAPKGEATDRLLERKKPS
jgi:hypothetical protein